MRSLIERIGGFFFSKKDLQKMPDPERTLAVIFGASEFPYCKEFNKSISFRNSAESFKNYLISTDHFNLPEENLLYLFDVAFSSTDIASKIFTFIKSHAVEICEKYPDGAIDIIVYFVGHADTQGFSNDLFFAIQDTRDEFVGSSSILCSTLAKIIKEEQQGKFRRHIILDCCYAAKAASHFLHQSTNCELFSKIEDYFPERGTALLCSSDGHLRSIAPKELKYTAFSNELIDILENGDDKADDYLSLGDLKIIIRERLKLSKFEPPCPVLHNTEQHCGEVSNMPLFVNKSRNRKHEQRDKNLVGVVKSDEKFEFFYFMRNVICYNQGAYAQYSFLTEELHKKLESYMLEHELYNSKEADKIREICNALENYLNRNLEIISSNNFTYIKQYFKDRHPIEPRVCVKAGLQRSNEKYVVELFRDTKVSYLTEYPIGANTGFQNVNVYGRRFFCNNIPEAIADGRYINARINQNLAKAYWEKRKEKNNTADYDKEWIECWVESQTNNSIVHVSPTSCYKSTIIIPMTFWNNELDDSFRNLIKIKGGNIERLILGYLCFDHIKEDYFYEDIDVDMGYIFADIFSLYMWVQATYTKYSETYRNAQQFFLPSFMRDKQLSLHLNGSTLESNPPKTP